MQINGLEIGTIPKVFIFGGAGSVLLSIVMAFGGFDAVQNFGVTRMIRLVEDSHIWFIWKDIPIPIYFKFYIFNITNADRLQLGEKPDLKEIGPYTYLLKLSKVDITINHTEDTLRYRQPRYMYFQPHLSSGSQSDEVTYINMIFLAVAHMAHEFTDIDAVLETLDNMLSEAGETLTRTSTIGEFLFTGISIQPYVDLVNDPLVQSAGEIELPEQFADGKFAVFKGKNGTDDGWWVVRSGITNTKDFGRVVSVNDKTKLDLWKGDTCNMLNGTDGTLYPPFIEAGITRLQAFSGEICRSISWKYHNETVTRGVHVARHTLPDFLTPEEDPDSWCFCPRDNPKECNITGMGSLAPCYGGAPILFSKPHFYKTHETVGKLVLGMNPDSTKHESWIDLHALTGSTIQAFIRVQLSIELMNYAAMPSFVNVSRSIVPFAWVEQTATLDDLNIFLIASVESFRRAYPILRFLFILLSFGTIGTGFALAYKKKLDNSVKQMPIDPVTVVEVASNPKDFALDFATKE